jgi:hypothetical protein
MFLARIILAVSSIEFCQSIFEEYDIRYGLAAEVRGMALPLEIESTFIEMI